MHAKAMMEYEEFIKVILFVITAFFVIIFISKACSYKPLIPEWSRSLSNLETAINNLNDKTAGDMAISRSATVMLLKSYYIQGFSADDAICGIDKEKYKDKPDCICACNKNGCKNALDESEKYCRHIAFRPVDGFLIESRDEKTISYEVFLVKSGKDTLVNISAVSGV
jgi:hypothetical protein